MSITIRIMPGASNPEARDLIIDKTTILIGRDPTQDVRLDNDTVSRRHAVIECHEGLWGIQDEGSENGTLLNGSKVAERTPISHGDAIEIGSVLLTIGIDRPLEIEQKVIPQTKRVSAIVRSINLLCIFIALGALAASLWFINEVKLYNEALKAPFAIDIGEELTLDILDGADRRDISFGSLANWPLAHYYDAAIYYPEPDWNLKDIWTAANKGERPRLFDGLDISLHGGNQIALSSYFYATQRYFAADANDPYGRLHFDIEGHGGLGPRNAREQVPAIRMLELPHFLTNIRLYPADIKPYDKPGYEGGQIATFTYTQELDPSYGHPIVYPKYRTLLADKILPPLVAKEVLFKGKYYSFFHDGCRYSAMVRGSAHMLDRFPGGLDALADAFFASIKFPEKEGRPLRQTAAEIETEASELTQACLYTSPKAIFMETLDKKERVLNDLRYEDLLGIRNLVLRLQRHPVELDVEGPFTRAYFELRNRAQDELELSMAQIHEERRKETAEKGVRELQRIHDFLDNISTLGLPKNVRPEWGRFYETVKKKAPYAD